MSLSVVTSERSAWSGIYGASTGYGLWRYAGASSLGHLPMETGNAWKATWYPLLQSWLQSWCHCMLVVAFSLFPSATQPKTRNRSHTMPIISMCFHNRRQVLWLAL